MRLLRLAVPALVSGFLGIPYLVQPAAAQVAILDEPAALALGVGGYNVLHNQQNDVVFRGEYRFGTKLFFLRPIIGAEVNTGGGAYGYGGFSAEVGIGQHFVLVPSAAVGLWEGGSSKKLGSYVEFRTGAEFDYRFDDASRVGFSFHHISNAGFTQRNPGVEEALLVYAFPLGFQGP